MGQIPGPPGPPGPPGASAIIPFSSGEAVALTTLLGGIAGTQGIIGFGSSTEAALVAGLIDTTNIFNMAFSMPREGVITSIAAYFSVTVDAFLVGSEVTITAQLYGSATPNNIFSPIPGTQVTLSPTLTGLVDVGTITSGIVTGLSISVPAETRLMMVFSAAVTGGVDIATIITGVASAGVSID